MLRYCVVQKNILRRNIRPLFASESGERYSANVSPGDVNSTLSNDLGFGGHEMPDQGADTPVWLATHPIGQQKTGRYYKYRRESNCTFSRDMQAVNELYEICATYSIGQFRSQAG